jgi:hypothetical protein
MTLNYYNVLNISPYTRKVYQLPPMGDVPDPLPFSRCRYPGRADGRSAMGNLTPVRRPPSDPCESFSPAHGLGLRDRTRDVDRIRNTPPHALTFTLSLQIIHQARPICRLLPP